MFKCGSFVSQTLKLFCKFHGDDIFKNQTRVPVAGLKYYPPKEVVDKSDWPKDRKLRVQQKQPDFGSVKPPKMGKMLKLLRGPEAVHTDLIYQCYGVKALLGGRLKYEHFEFIRNTIARNLKTSRMFALWRVEAPWQPVSKRGTGKRMGGGKGGIHHYVTPVKADRIIIELGGDMEDIEAKKLLAPIANSLPFPARVVSQKDLDRERANEKWVQENNANPYTMEYVIMNNMGGCKDWLSKHDYKWLGRYK